MAASHWNTISATTAAGSLLAAQGARAALEFQNQGANDITISTDPNVVAGVGILLKGGLTPPDFYAESGPYCSKEAWYAIASTLTATVATMDRY